MNMLLVFASMVSLTLAVPATGHSSPPRTGDWLELIDVTRLAYLRDGVGTQASSYNRAGTNDDGFSGTYSFIRKEENEWVFFEEEGPGCVYRIWTATPSCNGIKFYFDGETEPRISIPDMHDLFSGKYEPFVPPISQELVGGGVSYVPIPFEKSIKIVADAPWNFKDTAHAFYHINWEKFPSNRKVKTFSKTMNDAEREKFELVRKTWSSAGDIPWPVSPTAQQSNKNDTAAMGQTVTVANLAGPGIVRSLKIKADCADDLMYRKALLEVLIDGMDKPAVWSPLGDFFLDGFGQKISRSLLIGRKDDAYYCYFPMPFEKSLAIRVVNDADDVIRMESEVVWEQMAELPEGMGRFLAWWHRQNQTLARELFPILEVKGRGHWCGVSHAMIGHTGSFAYLEGDEMAWIDGRDNSSYNGTGTEDYFNGGFYFERTGSGPLSGCGVYDDVRYRCLAFRIHLGDSVPFQNAARIGIEHGPVSEVDADYAGVTYWYAEPGASHTFKSVEVGGRLP